jgi:hypothetical protein
VVKSFHPLGFRFFSTLKSELADRFDSCGDAKMELFDYIEVFYNQRSRHSTLGQISSARLRATHDGGVVMMRGRMMAATIRTSCSTGTPPSAQQLLRPMTETL